MKIQKNKKIIVISTVTTILILIGSVLAAIYLTSPKQDKETTPVRSQSDVDQATKLADNPDNKNSSPNSDNPTTPPTATQPSGKKNVPIIISANPLGNTVYIRGGLGYPVLEEGGSCYATLTNSSGLSIRKDTDILQNPASTDCKTISLSSPELPKGSWKAVLHFTSTSYEGSSNEVDFTIN